MKGSKEMSKNHKNHINFIENADIPALSGIYLLRDIKTGQVYIGNSVNIRARIATHRSLLQAKNHNNQKLQKLYNNGVLTVEILVSFPFSDKKRLKETERIFLEAADVIFPAGIVNRKTTTPFHQKKRLS